MNKTAFIILVLSNISSWCGFIYASYTHNTQLMILWGVLLIVTTNNLNHYNTK